MDPLFDRISRILATPMSRSRAIWLILTGVTSAITATFVYAQGRGQAQCPEPRFCPGISEPPRGAGSCCPVGTRCCPAGPGHSQSFCCATASVCCGAVCCPTDTKFCEGGNICRDRTPSDPEP